MIKVCVISDLHGNLPELEPSELILICGDIVPLRFQNNSKYSKEWYNYVFKEWVDKQRCDKILFVPGNHDLDIERSTQTYKNMFPHYTKATMLINESYDYLGSDGKIYHIFGTPYCNMFGNWAFMKYESDLVKVYSDIPDNLDILISHDAPYGCSDVCVQNLRNPTEHLGNIPLRDAVLKKKPKVLYHGHLHTSNHECEMLGETKVYNTSLVDEYYNLAYNPLYETI